jgi:mxaC protein
MNVHQPLWLWLAPLALLPWLVGAGRPLSNTWVTLLPRDVASEALHAALRAAATLAIAALVIGLAGPYRPEYPVERVGRGAEIVLVLDRSRSMDERFAGNAGPGGPPAGTGNAAVEYYLRLRHGSAESKGQVARRVLSTFVAQRPEDRFGMIVFSTLPMRVLEFTAKAEVIQAAIAAGNVGRGLSETDIGAALLEALSYFEDRAYTGSRLIMLVSDGGDRLDPDVRERIAFLARKHRVGLTWLYIRTRNSPGLMQGVDDPPAAADTVPEYFLHRFFQSLGTPYRAYEAENPEALAQAVAEVNRLENLPITYTDTIPRRELAPWCWGAALAGVLVLLAARRLELRSWA